MPIEFPCSGCQQRLRVPDNSAGKQAKCPNCSMVLTVPAAETQREPDAPLSPAHESNPFDFGGGDFGDGDFGDGGGGTAGTQFPGAVPQNPYASPAVASEPARTAGGALSVQPMDPGLAVSVAWSLFKLNAGLLVGAYVIQMVANIAITIAGGIVQFGLIQSLGDPNHPAIVLSNVGTNLINYLIQWWITIGFLRINL